MRTMSLSKSTAQSASRRRGSTRRTAPAGAMNKSLSAAATNVGKRCGDKRPRKSTDTKRIKRDPTSDTPTTIYLNGDGVRSPIVAPNDRPTTSTRAHTRTSVETTSIIVLTIGLLLGLLFAATIYSFGAAIRNR
ncbi:m13 [Muromegalovirus WP15B]|uniref:M13 n=1 Tax=Muromegalovirus WP15B TaxID=524651 RepID=B3UXE0_MUHV1|nr:m13 [Muromegalovirus WP15B]